MAQEPNDDTDRENRVLIQVCLECGKEYTFQDDEPPADLTCEKCGNTVFRPFYDSGGDRVEEEEDFEETTGRDLATDAGATDVRRTDVLDLDNP